MSEPEELILEGAHFATRLARDVWRRHAAASAIAGPGSPGSADAWKRSWPRCFGTPITIAPCRTRPRRPRGSRELARSARSIVPDADPFCGTDGGACSCRRCCPCKGSEEETIAAYRLLAVQQSARLSRHTLRAFDRIRNDRARDWFMLAEAAVIDHWVFVHTPGLLRRAASCSCRGPCRASSGRGCR